MVLWFAGLAVAQFVIPFPGASLGSGGGAAITIANQGSNFDNSGVPQSSIATPAFSAALTNPSVIIAAVTCGSVSVGNVITDTAGNTYMDTGVGKLVFGAVAEGQVFYAKNTHTTASNVITNTPSVACAFPRILAVEIKGANATTPLDQFAGQSSTTGGSGANVMTSTAATTTANGDFIFGWCPSLNGTVSAGTSPNSFSLIDNPGNVVGERFTQSSAGSIAATCGNTMASDPYIAFMAAFKQ